MNTLTLSIVHPPKYAGALNNNIQEKKYENPCMDLANTEYLYIGQLDCM